MRTRLGGSRLPPRFPPMQDRTEFLVSGEAMNGLPFQFVGLPVAALADIVDEGLSPVTIVVAGARTVTEVDLAFVSKAELRAVAKFMLSAMARSASSRTSSMPG